MRYVHTNIAARDWRTLSEFYIEVFKCKPKPPQRNLSGKWLDQATGLTNAVLEGMHLLLPGYEENGPTLEIFTYKEMQDDGSVLANHIGFTHIAFAVEDVPQTLHLALHHGASVLGEITEKRIDGVGLLTFVYFRDPEGNIIEIQSIDKE